MRLFLTKLEKQKPTGIDKKIGKWQKEVWKEVDCLSCANCCKNYSPRFKTPDIKRISKHLRMREGAFIDQYLRLDEEGDYVVKSSPCAFLQQDNTCRIYDERPSDCARFPYTNEDVLLKRPALTLKNVSFCPVTYYVMERLRLSFGQDQK